MDKTQVEAVIAKFPKHNLEELKIPQMLENYKHDLNSLHVIHHQIEHSQFAGSKLISEVIFKHADYSDRCLEYTDKTLNKWLNRLNVEYWDNLIGYNGLNLNNHYAYLECCGSRDLNLSHVFYPYRMQDSSKDKLYNGVLEITAFTEENIISFMNQYGNPNITFIKTFLKAFLQRSGADHKKALFEFKTKMTWRGNTSGSDVKGSLGLLRLILEWTEGNNPSPKNLSDWLDYDSVSGCMKVLSDEGLNKGVKYFTVERHLNGNCTLRFSKEVCELLNGLLNY